MFRPWILLAPAALSACGGREPTPIPATPAPPSVRIALVGGTQSAGTVTAVGTVAMRRETPLGFTSAGRIARLTVNEGDTVVAGQLLAALDTTTVAADVASAEAERERAAAELRRSETLMRQGWITRPRLDNARAALLAADARASAAGFQRSNAVITAPGRGVVLARLAEPGQVVPVGTPVLTLGETASGYVLRVPVNDRDAATMRVGAPVRVQLASLGEDSITGSVAEVGGRADRATGTFTVEVALPADPRLRSGQIGEARITASGADAQALAVPPAAIFAPRAGEGLVYVVDRRTNQVALRRVALGDASDGAVRVTGGLRRGEWVAVSRVDRLADKMRIVPLRNTP